MFRRSNTGPMATSLMPTSGQLEDKSTLLNSFEWNKHLDGWLLWNGQPLMGGVVWPTHLLPPEGE